MNPVVLCILDGFGEAEEHAFNATIQASFIEKLKKRYPSTLLHASGKYVGLPDGQMGGSEVGHLTIGAGKIIKQDLVRINEALDASLEGIQKLIHAKGKIHLMGLFSDGGIHSHVDHLQKIIDILCEHKQRVYLHLFLDGRDSPPESAREMLSRLSLKDSRIVTLMGRFFAMDRDNRLERTHLAYETMLLGKSEYHFASFEDAISFFYAKGITDEFIPPCIIGDEKTPLMKNGDSLMMINFRADRAKQIMRCFLGKETQTNFSPPKFEHVIGMCAYDPSFTDKMDALFEKQHPKDSLGEIVARHGYAQLRIAETEKYAHVTFFFSGQEAPFDKEDRILIPSPKVKTYDLSPEMSAFSITQTLIPIIASNQYALIVVNYANADMVGHSGNFDATCKAIKTIDSCVQDLYGACEKSKTTLIITADHGNAECMYDEPHHCLHTAHTCSKVPLIVIPGHRDTRVDLPKNAGLADIKNIVLQQMQL